MPIYAFACDACGHAFDRLQKLSDADPSDCPACGKPELKKLISAVGFRLKGSGWYETDFKGGDKKRNVAKEDSAPPSESKSAPACDGAGGCGACPAPATP